MGEENGESNEEVDGSKDKQSSVGVPTVVVDGHFVLLVCGSLWY